MNCLVIGGAGFIGSHLSEYLVSRGNKVKILDNFSTGQRENVNGLRLGIMDSDIRNIHDVKKAVRGAHVVFHLAALSSSECSEEEIHAVNAQGTLNILDACMDAGVKRVVVSSSSSVYRAQKNQSCHEFMDTTPTSPYGVSKLLGEVYCQTYWNLYKLETVVLRYFNVFGPRQTSYNENGAAFPLLKEVLDKGSIQVFGEGAQKHDFTYIDNVVHANALAAASPKAAGKIFNIAKGKGRSALDVLRLLNECSDREIRLGSENKANIEPRPPRASIDLAREYLGYFPVVGFEEGLTRTVAWYRSAHEKNGLSAAPVLPAESIHAAPVPDIEFPRVRELGLSGNKVLPLQIQRWLSDFSEAVHIQLPSDKRPLSKKARRGTAR